LEQEDKPYQSIDEALEPFSNMVEMLSDITSSAQEENVWNAMRIDQMRMDFPCELDVIVDENGKVTLGSAPPTQQIETSFMPVIHNMKLTITELSKLYDE